MELNSQNIATIVDQTVNHPKPIRKMSDAALIQEVRDLNEVLYFAINANQEHFRASDKALKATPEGRAILEDDNRDPIRADHEHLVTPALLAKLELRLKLCNTEHTNRARNPKSAFYVQEVVLND